MREPPPRAGIVTARMKVRKTCVSGVDPAVVQLFELVTPLAGYWQFIADKAGVNRRCMGRWFSGTTSPSVANLRAVLNAIGYDIRIERKP